MTQSAKGKSGLVYVAAAIVLAGVLVSATLVVAPISHSTTTATTTVTSVSTQTITTDLPAQCLVTSASYSAGYFSALKAETTSPAVICVQLFEFNNSTAPTVLHPFDLISITGSNPETGSAVDGDSNFTIAASPFNVYLGGPTNINEGIIVALAITANPGTSGTYFVGLSQQALLLTNGGGTTGNIGVLIAGTGKPDYAPPSVITPLVQSCTSSLTIPALPNAVSGICPNTLYYRITDWANSTQ